MDVSSVSVFKSTGSSALNPKATSWNSIRRRKTNSNVGGILSRGIFSGATTSTLCRPSTYKKVETMGSEVSARRGMPYPVGKGWVAMIDRIGVELLPHFFVALLATSDVELWHEIWHDVTPICRGFF